MPDDALRAWFDERVADHTFSGVAMAWRDGGPIFSYAGGLAHRGLGVPIDERSRFATASVTKMVTAIATLRLVERGLVRLEQPILDVLPPEQRIAALTPAHTLHHLLSHSSGLPDYVDEDDETWASWNALWDRLPMYHVRRPADLLPLFRDLPAVFPPGERTKYNDAGFVLAGLVIEAVTGRPYSEVVADEVVTPAGMVDSGFQALDDDPPRLAMGYVKDEGPPERWRTNIYSSTAIGMPDGGMLSTPVDLARLIDALNDGRLLSPRLVATMTAPQGPPSTDVERWGYGCDLAVEDGRVTIVGHSGGDPGVSAKLYHHLDSRLTICVLCNQDTGSWEAYLRIAEAFGLTLPWT